MMDQTTQDLQAAYDYLEEHGWCQEMFQAADGRVCLDGALMIATVGYAYVIEPGLVDQTSLARHLNARNRVRSELGGGGIFGWNDSPERSIEDVKLILKKAINQDYLTAS
jgi:hypothetical protein